MNIYTHTEKKQKKFPDYNVMVYCVKCFVYMLTCQISCIINCVFCSCKWMYFIVLVLERICKNCRKWVHLFCSILYSTSTCTSTYTSWLLHIEIPSDTFPTVSQKENYNKILNCWINTNTFFLVLYYFWNACCSTIHGDTHTVCTQGGTSSKKIKKKVFQTCWPISFASLVVRTCRNLCDYFYLLVNQKKKKRREEKIIINF